MKAKFDKSNLIQVDHLKHPVKTVKRQFNGGRKYLQTTDPTKDSSMDPKELLKSTVLLENGQKSGVYL
jgi:hypothetical protein